MSRRLWTPSEVTALRQLYPALRTADVAKRLGMDIKRVYSKANALGLHKTDSYLNSPEACRLRRGDEVGKEFRFKPGQPAWNKGMKGLDIGGKATRFCEGMLPHNTKPIGTYRIDKQGLLQQKISHTKGNNSKRWRGVHELVWVAANGPVPAGHIVVFKPGMRTTIAEEITPDKVECITLAENMRRNTCHNYGPEVARLVQLRGAITRQINRRKPE